LLMKVRSSALTFGGIAIRFPTLLQNQTVVHSTYRTVKHDEIYIG